MVQESRDRDGEPPVLPIRTRRLVLRQHRDDDEDRLLEILGDPDTMSFWPHPFSREETRAWMQRSREAAPGGPCRMALIERDTGRLIGDMGFFRVEILGRMENDLGWILDRHAWGKGYATEAGKALIETGWDVYGMQRIIANMAVDHLASRGVAERLGMQLERTFANPRNRGIETCLYVIEKP